MGNPLGHASAVYDAVKAAKASLTIDALADDFRRPPVGNNISLTRSSEDVQPGNRFGDYPAVKVHRILYDLSLRAVKINFPAETASQGLGDLWCTAASPVR